MFIFHLLYRNESNQSHVLSSEIYLTCLFKLIDKSIIDSNVFHNSIIFIAQMIEYILFNSNKEKLYWYKQKISLLLFILFSIEYIEYDMISLRYGLFLCFGKKVIKNSIFSLIIDKMIQLKFNSITNPKMQSFISFINAKKYTTKKLLLTISNSINFGNVTKMLLKKEYPIVLLWFLLLNEKQLNENEIKMLIEKYSNKINRNTFTNELIKKINEKNNNTDIDRLFIKTS